jgi:hypothetical protein
MVSATDGSAFTGSVTVSVTLDAGTQATGSVGSGACTHEGNGYHTYAPAQAETNGDLAAFTFTGTGAIPATIQIYTLPTTGVLAPTTAGRTLDVTAGGNAGIDWANVETPGSTVSLSATTVNLVTTTTTATTATNLTNLPTIPANWLTAAGTAADFGTEIGTAVWATGTRVLTANTNLNDPTAAAIADAVWDEDATGHQTGGTFGQAIGDPGANTETLYKAIVTDPAGTNIAADIIAIKAETASILTDTAEIGAAGAGLTEAGGTGDHLTAIPWNASWDAQVQSEVEDGLAAYDAATGTDVTNAAANVSVDEIQATALADLFNTDSGTTFASAVAGSVVKEIADNAGGSSLTEAGIAETVAEYMFSYDTSLNYAGADANSVVKQIADNAGGSSLTAADIADAVWEEAQADHASAGTFGIIASEIADILVDTSTTLQAELDGIQADTEDLQAKLGTPSDFGSGTSTIAANLQDMADNGTATFDRSTDSLQAIRDRGDAAWPTATGFSTHSAADVWAAGTRTLTALDEDSTTLDLDATIRGAVGLASANLDTQIADIEGKVDDLETRLGTPSNLGSGATVAANLADIEAQTDNLPGIETKIDDLPTSAELATALGTADDAVLAAIAGLNDLSAAQVNAEVDAAIETYHLDHLLAVAYDPASKPGAADALLNELVESDAGVSRFTANALEQAPTGGSAPSAADIRAEIDSNSTQLAAIVADTNELQSDWVNGGRLDLILDARASQTSVDDLPTNAELATALTPIAKEATLGTPADTDIATDIANSKTAIVNTQALVLSK